MLTSQLQVAIKLRNEKKLRESNQIIMELVQQYPENAHINFQCAWSLDCLGEEKKAVAFYEKAIQGELEDSDLMSAFLGLGSTLRTLGDYERAKTVLREAVGRFPDHQALRAFYAMTLYNVNEYQEAIEILLSSLATTSADPTIQRYKRAILFYSDKLDETWK
ncbi:tetratricopeptide (TPR) repeat protein [Sporosarcina luteola]|nr:tetratricopeptide (TPR) repeat protein [Sporosarcina luteola]